MDERIIAGMRFGSSQQRICIPITARDLAGLISQIYEGVVLPGDLFEWRMDYYTGDKGIALKAYRKFSGKPLLCTLRTRSQGGEAELSPEEYEQELMRWIQTGGFSLVDVELSVGREAVGRLISAAHKRGIAVVLSQHDFTGTPSVKEMTDTLVLMRELGADLPKLAVMPETLLDVLALMEAAWRASRLVGPVAAMSMGEVGKLSRISGYFTGSCMSFGAGAEASAPGQMDAETLSQILKALEKGAKTVFRNERG